MTGPGAKGPEDDVKRRMREALDKKKQKSHPTSAGSNPDGSERMHPVEGHIPTAMHRRKAGGGGA
ncbi:DUF5302 family protein [Auraticoccus monumenti]|uniref:DUF5302 domain-containing protein n=1 Tax=Auraticoccus monumenti TaxID=675864 RepID=A0A1G7EHF2_9ACTN|nr:DUF5302 family protein [Auraticoccus monumenti]SDE63104.1 hypothetical protein SAMN04489747_3946 [Auraticoccus monumenti]